MDKLDDLVASHLEERLLQPKRLETILGNLLDRREERAERRREHLAELNRRITETDQRLNRLYDAIEAGLADLNDSVLKESMAGLKAIRDQATADAERVQMTLDSAGNQAITVDMIGAFTMRPATDCDSKGRLSAGSPARLSPARRGRRHRGLQCREPRPLLEKG